MFFVNIIAAGRTTGSNETKQFTLAAAVCSIRGVLSACVSPGAEHPAVFAENK